ncbi:C-C motif chemokine 3-like [Opisthocomus hoazin]|uniref:C-C motif chemokine 3-like n=1 Tax=Opisthocomus hoazin TaxID=30419 RepID=UPI003F53464B
MEAKATDAEQGSTKQSPGKNHHAATMLTARSVLLLALLLPFSLDCAVAHHTPVECCYSYAKRSIRHVQSFYQTPRSCVLRAVVIVAASGNKVCADPEKPWVKKAMEKVSRKK